MKLAWFQRERPPKTADEAYGGLFAVQRELAQATDSRLARRLELRKAMIALHDVNGQLLEVCAQLIRQPSEDLYAQADDLIAQVGMIRKSIR